MFDTRAFSDELRTEEYNGLHGFSECEVCGVKEPVSVNIRYCDRFKIVACDRCIDNLDGLTPWTDEHAKRWGLPPFPKGYSYER